MNPHGPVGLFGKVPAQGDFLRMNIADPVALALVRWLEDGNEALHRAGAQLAPEPFAFLFRVPEGDRALMGVLGPGTDKVGRSFPLAVFAPASARSLAAIFPLVPALYRSFLDAARALIVVAAELTPAQIVERLRQLPLPGPDEAAVARAWPSAAGSELARDWRQRLFADSPEGQHYYAFHTFQVACQSARGKDLGQAGLALDCPCSRETDVWVWLELARAALGWPGPPAFFWRDAATPELVLSLGIPPPAVLPRLSATPRENQRIWPLRTKQAQAITAARKAFSAAQLVALDSAEVTIEDLVASISRF